MDEGTLSIVINLWKTFNAHFCLVIAYFYKIQEKRVIIVRGYVILFPVSGERLQAGKKNR
ncbi:hypothetical protein DEH81_00450 [Pectobacterium zantedeschiae]|uniref:Uncharacterized protein n=1 Tax=Pectobacterium zantedeschiae TaxID=2034769 RepID=A0A9X8JLR4_9GAMM|nr:hypothetical protein CTN06_21935 [Pectobacterium zantedeschiae]RYC46036.1 hypothetical protein CLR69_14105 [Pectobacterium zantedeschiae]RYC46901.1 hypothetical protein DEH81_00450 [Pectobacterium zantedeschiae]